MGNERTEKKETTPRFRIWGFSVGFADVGLREEKENENNSVIGGWLHERRIG